MSNVMTQHSKFIRWLIDQLGIPDGVKAFELRAAVDDVVSLWVEYYPEELDVVPEYKKFNLKFEEERTAPTLAAGQAKSIAMEQAGSLFAFAIKLEEIEFVAQELMWYITFSFDKLSSPTNTQTHETQYFLFRVSDKNAELVDIKPRTDLQ